LHLNPLPLECLQCGREFSQKEGTLTLRLGGELTTLLLGPLGLSAHLLSELSLKPCSLLSQGMQEVKL
jgi:hypothetical protein